MIIMTRMDSESDSGESESESRSESRPTVRRSDSLPPGQAPSRSLSLSHGAAGA